MPSQVCFCPHVWFCSLRFYHLKLPTIPPLTKVIVSLQSQPKFSMDSSLCSVDLFLTTWDNRYVVRLDIRHHD